MGLSCKLRLFRFSVRLKFQDRAVCGNYEVGLIKAGLESLENRRINCCSKFADKCLIEKTKPMFPPKEKEL